MATINLKASSNLCCMWKLCPFQLNIQSRLTPRPYGNGAEAWMGTWDEKGPPRLWPSCQMGFGRTRNSLENRWSVFSFKYLLGTFHVLKTLASLKISRAFLFKYSMCVGQPRFPICLGGELHVFWWHAMQRRKIAEALFLVFLYKAALPASEVPVCP